jgi:hypothetical protein
MSSSYHLLNSLKKTLSLQAATEDKENVLLDVPVQFSSGVFTGFPSVCFFL